MSDIPYLTSDDLMLLFGYKNLQTLYNAVSKGTFPIPTYKIGKYLVADREVAREFFASQRQEALDKLARKQERNAGSYEDVDTSGWDDVTD